jgi:hypothetical protein
MAGIKGLNAHDRPPERIRNAYKKYQKYQASEVDNDPHIIDLEKLDRDHLPSSITQSGSMSSKDLRRAFDEFVMGEHASSVEEPSGGLIEDIPIFTHHLVSGSYCLILFFSLYISLLPPFPFLTVEFNDFQGSL